MVTALWKVNYQAIIISAQIEDSGLDDRRVATRYDNKASHYEALLSLQA